MRKILLTSTALIALGSVSAVAADISISGNMRFRYNTWSDDNAAAAGENNNSMTNIMQLWVQSSADLDNGVSIGTNTRIRRGGNIDRNWIDIDGDFGKIDLGQQWPVHYQGSLHENWAATIAGGVFMGGSDNGEAVAARNAFSAADSGTGVAVTRRLAQDATGLAAMNTTGYLGGDTANKINWHLPSVGGFNAAIGLADAGADSEANETSIAVSYTMPMPIASGSLKAVYLSRDVAAEDRTENENAGSEIGIEYSSDFGRLYALQQNVSSTNPIGSKVNDQEGTTFGINYNLNDAAQMVYYRQETDQDGTVDTGDKFSSDTIGVRYDIAGGLRRAFGG